MNATPSPACATHTAPATPPRRPALRLVRNPIIPPVVAEHLDRGDKHGAAESLAHLANNEEISTDEVAASLAAIVPHLDAKGLMFLFEEDVCLQVNRWTEAYCGNSADLAEATAEVDRAINELIGATK